MSGGGRPAIVVHDVWLQYRTSPDRVTSFKEYIIRRLRGDLRVSEFWALREVSFQVNPGEVLGILGRNGSGKTTLLKIIARVLRPTRGRVVVRGLAAPLLGLGIGFNNELTGRENVFLAGATLGFPAAEMRRRFDEIVDFAGIGEFIDMPIRTYSSGMRARLGFAVATSIRPDVLLLDEVLAVGDLEFRDRCTERIGTFREQGITTVLVSHSVQSILDICGRAILLDRGRMVIEGTPEEVVGRYHEVLKARRGAGTERGDGPPKH